VTVSPEGDPPRRFRDALENARVAWAAADPVTQALRAGCDATEHGVLVPLFGHEHLVTHPGGVVSAGGKPVHAAVAILLLHYLTRADGAPQAVDWITFRELPDGLFYAASFAARAESPLALMFGGEFPGHGLPEFREAAVAAGGEALDFGDASFSFPALPRLRLAALLWEGDEDFPPEARVVFDAAADHYLPAEDLAGLGEVLTRMLTRER
jgi:hypothetical protein